MKRRELLKLMGTAAGAASATRLFPGCAPAPLPGRISTHVFLMMENRSYDHVLGTRSLDEGLAGDGLVAGLSNPDRQQRPVGAWPATDPTMCVEDPPHSWDGSREQFANGANTGFVTSHQVRHDSDTAIEPMQYLRRAHMPVTHALADVSAIADRWFCSVMGPTQPNRMHWLAGTSNGAKANDQVLAGSMHGLPNLFTRLDDAGVEWAYYYGDIPILTLLGGEFGARIQPFFPNFLDDAAAGHLPSVVFIDPAFSGNDDHPPKHPLLGQQLISAAYRALSTSPHWDESLMLLTYDEHGGFYDHVPPPKVQDDFAAQGFDQLGFRVPTVAIGPYVRAGAVSSTIHDHASVMRHLVKTYDLEPLNTRTRTANDLTDLLDHDRLARGAAAAPVSLPAVEIDESQLPEACKLVLGRSVRYNHDILDWAAANPRAFGELDRRRHVRDDVYGIAEFLDRNGLGRIRRGGGRRYV